MLHELVDDLNDRRCHLSSLEMLVGTKVEIHQRFPQHTCLRDVDGNELQDPILRDNADNHRTLGLIINIDQWNPACAGFEHPPAGLVEGFQGVDGHRLDRSYSKSLLNVCLLNQHDYKEDDRNLNDLEDC